MLRHRAKANESDRFIIARSLEREININRFKINENNNNLDDSFNINTPTICKSAEPKTRTPLIVRDQKQISDKIYLSLLKTQLFKNKNYDENNERKNNFVSNKKRRRISEILNSSNKEESENQEYNNIHLIKRENEEENIINNNGFNTPRNFRTPSHNNFSQRINRVANYPNFSSSKIIKKLNFNNYNNFNNNNYINFNNCKSDSKFYKKRRLEIDNLGFDKSHNFKNSFKDLINFDVREEDKVDYTNLHNKKNIQSAPYKVLDAPKLRDDFYLHLLDWSNSDTLAVGLENSVYLWDGKSSRVGLVKNYEEDKVTSVGWMGNGNELLVGLNSGKINVFDVNKMKITHEYKNHTDRVGIFAPVNNTQNLFSSGSLDNKILNYDLRQKEKTSSFIGHTQEVCGLQWSHDGKMLASGGNDNKLMLWTLRKEAPEKKFNQHLSAVKAISWSYHKLGTLASGGGTQDRTIKLWNTNTMTLVESIDTCSQVCNLAFSKNTNEFVSTHGYSDNLILVWDFESLEVIATLKGHRDRVIYFSVSPDMNKIVTGAGDETIRFWHVFKEDENVDKNINKNYCKTSTNLNKFQIR